MKTKTHFTRKNFIAIALVYFFVILVLLSALLCDATNPIGLKESANIVKKISKIFSFPDINGSTGAYILLSCVLVYILIFVSALSAANAPRNTAPLTVQAMPVSWRILRRSFLSLLFLLM